MHFLHSAAASKQHEALFSVMSILKGSVQPSKMSPCDFGIPHEKMVWGEAELPIISCKS